MLKRRVETRHLIAQFRLRQTRVNHAHNVSAAVPDWLIRGNKNQAFTTKPRALNRSSPAAPRANTAFGLPSPPATEINVPIARSPRRLFNSGGDAQHIAPLVHSLKHRRRHFEELLHLIIAFIGLLILVFVGFQPFVPPTPGTSLAADAGQGDLIHQIFYLGVFALVMLTAVQRRGLAAMRAMPLVLGLLQVWCLLSAIWATEHGIAFRRAAEEVVLTMSVLFGADTIGPEHAFRYWRIVRRWCWR